MKDASAPPAAIVLMGPTAGGKTALAMQIAKSLAIEIISVDSAQVYRGMDVGTAKPDAAERAAVPHHLIDIRDPDQSYSAAQFCADANRLMLEIAGRGRIALLAGGTMLYFKALREGLSNLPPADAAVRAGIESEARLKGWPALHAELARIDAPTAARLKPGDAQRIQRALEVFRVSGKTLSQLQGARVTGAPARRYVQLALVPRERGLLHQRIAARFEAMLAAGLVEELAALRRRYELHSGLPAMRCVGYRQAWDHIEGKYDRAALRDRGIYATRQLAKRQLTWLRAMPELRGFDCFAPDLVAQALQYLERELSTSA